MLTEDVANTITANVKSDFLDCALSHGFGDIHFKVDSKTGMKAIIAIHNTNLGPALGGCRFIEYLNTETAIKDAMRLARGMSYKAALNNLPLGGGKAVIIKPAHPFERNHYLEAFGRFINELNGRYITAVDSGTDLSDMDIIAKYTPFVASLSQHNDSPSTSTAKGVLRGIEAAVQFKLGKNSLAGVHIAIQGLGHVGYLLAGYLTALGAKLTVADLNEQAVEQVIKEFGAKAVPANFIHRTPCDVFSPCALGAIINDETIPQLQTTIIAGAANNQLAHNYHGQVLHKRGILYAPDYVINSGGLIFAACKYLKTSIEQAEQKIDAIYACLLELFSRSKQEDLPTNEIADIIAQEKLTRTV